MEITKVHAADRLFAYAAESLFRGHDPVVVHSLFAAACNIYGDLNERENRSWREKIAEDHNLSVKEVVTIFDGSWNFFKHANKNPESILSFNPLDSEHIAMITTLERGDFFGSLSKEMQVFQFWYLKVHARPVTTDLAWKIDQMFPGIEMMDRPRQLQYGLQQLLKVKT